MNAVTYLRTVPVVHDETTAPDTLVMLVDMDIGRVQESLADMVEALFNERRTDPLRPALLAHIRDIQTCMARSREAAGQMRQMMVGRGS